MCSSNFLVFNLHPVQSERNAHQESTHILKTLQKVRKIWWIFMNTIGQIL